MKNIIITGTNGMIGGLILQLCLQREDVATITSITRKPIGISHPKLKEVIHQNFADFSSIEDNFKNKDICFYCVGVYTGQVPTDEFKKITVDYTRSFATTLKEYSLQVSFNFLSGQGADTTEKSKVLFAREKGIAENILDKLNFKSFHSYRPAYIYPVTKREEPNTMYKIMRAMYKPIKFLFPNYTITSEKLAQVIVHIGFNGSQKTFFENKEMRNFSI
jgi:nucleoside-diphosphate-sugar epimerase